MIADTLSASICLPSVIIPVWNKGQMDKDEPLKDTIKKVIAKIEEREKEELDVSKIWEKAAGKKASKHTKPAFLKSKRLVVNVSDSSWLYKLTLEKEGLIRGFNEGLKGRRKIKELQFRIGEI